MREVIRHIIREHTHEMKEARFSNYEIADEPYANIFYVFITEYNKSEGFQKSNLRKAFQYAIREYTGKPHKLISKKVANHFIENFPSINPFQVRWGQRKKYGTINGKSFLLFEHTTPIKSFLITLSKAKSLEDVLQAMRDYSGVCLMTRHEDDCLNSKGYISNRPNGWLQAYSSCGIDVMDENQFNQYRKNLLNSQNNEGID